jgi:DNA helicase-2/ATP-dependent DNA helicase PcrA
VVEILVDRILTSNEDRVVLGFFGDKLQSIYHGGEHPGIGEIPAAQRKKLIVVVKEENYRCSQAVIAVLNRIRTDIEQYPAGQNAKGLAVYIRSPPPKDDDDVVEKARALLWDKFGLSLEGIEQKELFLTHRLIAKKAGYEGLLKVYADRGGFSRDQFLSGEDGTISFLNKHVEPLVAAWEASQTGRVISVMRAGGFILMDNKSKATARAALQKLVTLRAGQSIGEVLSHLIQTRLLVLPDELSEQIQIRERGKPLLPAVTDDQQASEKFYVALLDTPYTEVIAFNKFLEEHSPFATKHGVKGNEFDTVFVVLDDKGAHWNLYSFDKYLSGEDEKAGKQDRADRTRNLFYVCCSRAETNLAVIDLGPTSPKKDARVAHLFGAEFTFL